jgi:hypothetical protein
MLFFEVSKLSIQCIIVVQKTSDHIETAKNALSMGLEFGRVGVGATDPGEQGPSLWVVTEQPRKWSTILQTDLATTQQSLRLLDKKCEK